MFLGMGVIIKAIYYIKRLGIGISYIRGNKGNGVMCGTAAKS